ncbi:unnamed protein product [Prorocentrum cordatum]|uniref:Uncharacterized protein n=1 Tax=Prorocentrum cordatum TaxID=2364126 RepID=A0ABN9YAU3_9DINO|nr:unnamed protein product [Polarella glacialis]
MLRALARPLCRSALPRVALTASRPAAPHAPAAVACRALAAKAGQKPKVEDGTLEGRYATALFMATSDRSEKVYQDLVGIRDMMKESPQFKLLIETPGIEGDAKVKALDAIVQKIKADPAILNFMKVLIENKRLYLLSRMIDLYETFYRAEKGLVLCKVTSAEALTSKQQAAVKAAMEKRAEKGSTLLMEYTTNPAILGGLVVKMGEAVLDQSVSTRLERLQTQLLAPVLS